jgi:transposase
MTLLPECLDDYVTEENPVRVVNVFVDELDLGALEFEGVDLAATGSPAFHPAASLKIYIYGYLNRIQSSCRLEREAWRNVELMWLTGVQLCTSKRLPTYAKPTAKAFAEFPSTTDFKISSRCDDEKSNISIRGRL